MTTPTVTVRAVDEEGYVIGGATGRDGRHLSDAELDAWVDQFAGPDHAVEGLPPARRRPGRPSLSGTSNHSPRITVRLAPEELRDIRALAKASGATQAQLLRKAVSEYLSTHPTAAADPQNVAH